MNEEKLLADWGWFSNHVKRTATRVAGNEDPYEAKEIVAWGSKAYHPVKNESVTTH